MKTELLLVRDGLEGAAPWMAQVLRDAGFRVRMASGAELGEIAPAEVDRRGQRVVEQPGVYPAAQCWRRLLHRRLATAGGTRGAGESGAALFHLAR